MVNTQTFLAAENFSSSITVAKVYLASRNVDYVNFCSNVLESFTRDARHVFVNGYSMVDVKDGTFALVDPDYKVKLFPTWEQFAAYFLAKFW